MKALSVRFLMVCLALATFLPLAGSASDSLRSNIYDTKADGTRQISSALALAKKTNKRVLLQFGANWCVWCHKLHLLFQVDKPIAKELKASYVLVLIDVNKDHNKTVDAAYHNPTRLGLPALVVLDADGHQLTTKDTGELEEGDHHSPEKVLDFLKQWEPQHSK